MDTQKLIDFIEQKIQHHEDCREEYTERNWEQGYHAGSVNAYKHALRELHEMTS